jgi:lycopene cyclase domain-containing protein
MVSSGIPRLLQLVNNMKFEYLGFNLLIGFLASLGGKMYPHRVMPKWTKLARVVGIVGTLFVIWDQIVTGWWWIFNSKYILGWQIGRLPMEEILFFVVVPTSCVFIWVNLKSKMGEKIYWPQKILAMGLIAAGLLVGKIYTGTVLIITGLTLGIDNNKFFQTKSGLVMSGVVIFLTLVFNTYLTARPILIYNPQVMTNIRIGSVPVEDIFYGWILVMWVIMAYEENLMLKFFKLKK